jgi:hypothetical protein
VFSGILFPVIRFPDISFHTTQKYGYRFRFRRSFTPTIALKVCNQKVTCNTVKIFQHKKYLGEEYKYGQNSIW